MSKTSFDTLCEQTPTLTISDNRGLAIRALAYNRIHTSDAPEELITRNRYNAVGQLIASRDARLDSDNFRYQYPLGGAALRTDGVDNGTSMQLTNIEGRPVMSLDAKGTRSWVTYEPELGRPLAHQQQPEGGQKTVTDRFFYGENSAEHKAANINGQCIRHYDTAGLQQVDSLSISGVALQQQRQLLTDTLGPVNWFGEEQSWASRLRRESFVTRCTTDILGQLITQTDAKGHTQRMAYNRAGQLSGSWLTIKKGTEQVIVKSLDYSAAGQKLREESGNGVVTEYRYEAETQRLIGIKTTRPAIKERPTLLQDLRYDYDPVGNILAIHNDAEATRFFRNQKIVPETTYRYDALYQLTEATGRESDSNRAQNASLPALSSLTDGNQYVNYTRRYSYDRAGNLLKIQHSGASQYSTNITISNISNHGIQQQDGLTAADIRCQFDAAGNQQQLQPGQPLQWDARHQLQQVTTVKRGAENTPNDDYEHYLYASDGMRVVKQSIQHTNNIRQISRVTYLLGLELRTQHNDSELMEDFQVITLGVAGRAKVRVLLWEKGQPAGIDNGQLRYSFNNQIGSSLLELDNNGDIISQEEYYPFGGTALFAARNTIEAKYKTVRYSGKERDATGLYYYGFRYYMPWLGRWLNADPAGTIDGLNLYRMVRNNPISLMDEDGRMPVRMTNDKESMIPTSIDYNIIIDTNIDYLYRADTRSPEEIEKAGGFSASGSIANAGTLGRFENGEPVEPILYTAEKVYGMKDFANKMPGERYFYKINASVLRVASYTKKFEGLKNTRNLVTHLKKQKQLMEKVIGEDWSNKTDTEIRKALITEDSSGPPSWMSLTTDAKEAHIIGDKKLLYKSKQLYEKDFQIPILVSWEKIEHIGSKEKGMLKKSKYMK
ncbi:TPA: RHS repeat domain-containing protein [Yersinia enterocolitica]|uniref:RHS repeat protein n=2 Tax=Yersinia enterocolitica TaxID=630 RepID=A0A7T9XQV0_YEREN|nr:RHS repeat domain-containing protein [Yersinia enterocolitica]QQU45456.1 RHS repeat protein [Yersinia enterocolitica]CFW62944.1 putative insecticidal toxin complex [Yersinia enterocolitica]CNC82075.1 putative insecticidal toxin complex [Yersinia enterocolitica]CNE97558.1 putative insecticidal toxin complex [Yersinia enterocolitica]CNH26473.1 putative insecticidal toxin complex [Yersinia enterocolitica]